MDGTRFEYDHGDDAVFHFFHGSKKIIMKLAISKEVIMTMDYRAVTVMKIFVMPFTVHINYSILLLSS